VRGDSILFYALLIYTFCTIDNRRSILNVILMLCLVASVKQGQTICFYIDLSLLSILIGVVFDSLLFDVNKLLANNNIPRNDTRY